MKEVAGAVVATSLVLVAVFVPVALFPGTTGILFRQFALTIAFSVAISAFNALTLTPALSAIFLGHHRERAQGRFFRAFNRALKASTHGYQASVRHVLGGWRYVAFAAFLLALGGTYFIYQKVPRGVIPEDDEGYLIVVIQAPQGASLEYTLGAVSKVEAAAANIPEVEGVFSVGGFSFSGSAPNRALVFIPLKPFRERQGAGHTAAAVLTRLRGPLMGIPEALVIPFNPPAVQGLGQFGGFQFVLEDQGRKTLHALADTANQMAEQSRTNPDPAGLFSRFTANDPQYLVHIDREKAKSLQVALNQITDALQVYMGSVYVNDFDF